MRSVFTKLSKPELDFLTDNIIFNDIELEVLKLSTKGYTEIQIGEKVGLSQSAVDKKRKRIRAEIKDFLEVLEDMTTVYVNGKRVTKEEVANMKIEIESVKRILAEKLAICQKKKDELTKNR